MKCDHENNPMSLARPSTAELINALFKAAKWIKREAKDIGGSDQHAAELAALIVRAWRTLGMIELLTISHSYRAAKKIHKHQPTLEETASIIEDAITNTGFIYHGLWIALDEFHTQSVEQGWHDCGKAPHGCMVKKTLEQIPYGCSCVTTKEKTTTAKYCDICFRKLTP